MKSASRPVPQNQLEDIKTTAKTPEGKLDKNGNTKKFCRDLDSDWTVKNDEPNYGLNEHAAVDTENGFILSVNMSTASHHDSRYFPYAICYSMHTGDPIEKAFGDKGYTGHPNRAFLALNNIGDGIMRKDNINAKLTDHEIERNKAISKYRYIVEQYFGISRLYDKGDRARFTTIFKNLMDLMFRQFAFNLKKGAKILETVPV